MPQLDPASYISQLFWLTLVFALLYLLLSKVILPPLLAVMQARDDKRAADIARAQALKNEAAHAREQYEMTLADAQLRSQQVFADAQTAIRQQAEKANADMDNILSAKFTQAQTAIAASKQELYNQLVSESAELVASIVEKFTHARPDSRLVADALQSIKRS